MESFKPLHCNLLSAAVLCALASPSRAAGPSPTPTAPPPVTAAVESTADAPATDAGLIAWREQVLPAIRSYLDADHDALDALAAECRRETDPERLRDLQERIEAHKLGVERHLMVAQRDWARAYGRMSLAERLTAALQSLDAAYPDLAAAGDGPAAAGP